MRQLFKQWPLILAFILGSGSEAFAGVVLKCVTPKSKVGRVCIVKSRFGKVRDRVIIKDRTQRRYWKATGFIQKDQGLYSVVVFKDTTEHISRGDYAEIESSDKDSALEWKSSFSNQDYF